MKPHKEQYVYYSRENRGKKRNLLWETIINTTSSALTPVLQSILNTITYHDVIYEDIHGNTTLHLAAYIGLFDVIEQLLTHFPQFPIDDLNKDGETALNLPIKKQGYWKVIKLLIGCGCKDSTLEQFAFQSGYITAQLLSTLGEIVKVATCIMQPSYIQFIYTTAMEKGHSLD